MRIREPLKKPSNPEVKKPQENNSSNKNNSPDYKPTGSVEITKITVPEAEPIKEEEDMAVNEYLAKSVAESSKKIEESVEGVKKLIEGLNKKKEVEMPGEQATPNLSPEKIVGLVEEVMDRRAKKDEEQKRVTAEQRKAQQDLAEAAVEQVITKRFCNPDGTMCFATKAELDAALSKGFTDVQENIKKILEEKKEEVKPIEEKPKIGTETEIEQKPMVEEKIISGIQPLLPINKNLRAGMDEKELEKRDAQVASTIDLANITYLDMWRAIKKSPVDLAAVKREAAEDMDLQEKLNACDLGNPEACKKAAESLQEKGLTIFKIDEKKKTWTPVDEKIKPKTTFLGG